ncbi:MAG TPA: DUF5667 domain-containing protein [Nitriliruptorales bacterium]
MRRVDEHTPEEQFALLLDGELRPDEVDHRIAALLTLTEALDEHVTVPSPEFGFKAQLRTQLVAAAAAGEQASVWERARNALWMRTAQVRNSLRTALATGVAASMIGTVGVAAAAQHALPGELLYPVKELTETVRIALAGDLAATGRLHLRFAEERLEEVDEGADELAPQRLIDTFGEMDEHAITGAEDLLGWATRTGDEAVLDEIRSFTDRQRKGLHEVISRLPSAVVPFAEASLEVLRRIDIEVDGEPEPCDCPEPQEPSLGPIDDDPVVSAPGEAPARTPQRPCDCTPGTDAPPVREPVIGDEPPQDPDGDPSDGEPPAEDEPVDLVPELPGPLDDVGNVIDDLFNDVLDESDPVMEPLPLDPEQDVIDPADETVDDLLDDSPTPTPSPSL